MRLRDITLCIAALTVAVGCSAPPEDHKGDLERRGFTDVQVVEKDHNITATVTLEECHGTKLRFMPTRSSQHPEYIWSYEAPHERRADPGQANDHGVTAAHLLARDDLKNCSRSTAPQMSLEDYKSDLQKRGFTDIRVSGAGNATEATVTVGTCHDIRLPWMGIRGYPTEWVKGTNKGAVLTPANGLTTKYLLTLPEFKIC